MGKAQALKFCKLHDRWHEVEHDEADYIDDEGTLTFVDRFGRPTGQTEDFRRKEDSR